MPAREIRRKLTCGEFWSPERWGRSDQSWCRHCDGTMAPTVWSRPMFALHRTGSRPGTSMSISTALNRSRSSTWSVVMRSAPSTTSPPCFRRRPKRSRTPPGGPTWTACTTSWRPRVSTVARYFFQARSALSATRHRASMLHRRPFTIYGVTKVAGELLCDYYAGRFGVDTRGLRLPGLISYVAPPGGGITDYAVEMFYQALRYKQYTCFLKADTRLPMMYMPDAIRATIELMEVDGARLRYRNAYNVAAMSITPAELAAVIRTHLPELAIGYRVDPIRQCIAESWPHSLDTAAARDDWGFAPQFDLAAMTVDMLMRLRAKLSAAAAD